MPELDKSSPATADIEDAALIQALETLSSRLALAGTVLNRLPASGAPRAAALVTTATTQLADLSTRAAQLDQANADLAEERTAAAALRTRNGQLAETLGKARAGIEALKERLDELSKPSNAVAIYQNDVADDLVIVAAGGREQRVAVDPEVDRAQLVPGTKVYLGESGAIVGVGGLPAEGTLTVFEELIGTDRARVTNTTGDSTVVRLFPGLDRETVKAGDSLLVYGNTAYEVVSKREMSELLLERVPDIDYDAIGGLADQIREIREAIEDPYLHPEIYAAHKQAMPKGVLLYGPPGCGKTLIAKAVANSLAKQAAAANGSQSHESYFVNIKGPELLTKWVGETERKIRVIFQQARDKAQEGIPVIVFFDEMESLFRTRGSGISSDMESTIVPQLLAELDGVDGLKNVIVIGATNRPDLIDPAVLRPGRMDRKFEIKRPDQAGAGEIFKVYLDADLPIHRDELGYGGASAAVERMIDAAIASVYAQTPQNEFIEATYANGEKETLYHSDFMSGALIESIVGRAKQASIRRQIHNDPEGAGIRIQDLLDGIASEFKENENLPNTTNPNDWAKIAGRKGERIVNITILSQSAQTTSRPVVTASNTGQYL